MKHVEDVSLSILFLLEAAKKTESFPGNNQVILAHGTQLPDGHGDDETFAGDEDNNRGQGSGHTSIR